MFPLEQLPEHVLVKIFSRTAPKDRLNLMEVCKYFNNLISTTKELMKDIRLVWKSPHEELVEQIDSLNNFISSMIQSNRFYTEIHLGQFYSNFVSVTKFPDLVQLTLDGGKLEQKELAVMVNNLPNLRNLHISSSCSFVRNDYAPKLKCDKLIRYSNNLDVIPAFDVCINLVLLDINMAYQQKFTLADVMFIKSQMNLESLDVDLRYKKVRQEVKTDLVNVILRLPKLKNLDLKMSRADGSTINFDGPPMKVKNAGFDILSDNDNTMLDFIKNMIRKMPKLKELDFDYDYDFKRNELDFLEDSSKLEELDLAAYSSILPNLKIKNLKSLKIFISDDDNDEHSETDWLAFLQNHRKLTHLKISYGMISKPAWDYLMENMKDFELLEINGYLRTLEKYNGRNFVCSNERFNVEFNFDPDEISCTSCDHSFSITAKRI